MKCYYCTIPLLFIAIGAFGADNEVVKSVTEEIPNAGIPKCNILNEKLAYIIRDGKYGNITYFPDSPFGISIEPKKLGNVISVTLSTNDDGSQVINLAIYDKGVTKTHNISFDKNGDMNIKVISAK